MSANLEAISVYSKQLTDARAALLSEQKVLASLKMANRQDFSTNLTVCGKKFALVTMGSNFYPERVKALDVIRLELINYREGVVQFHRGAVEGLKFRLAQAAREETGKRVIASARSELERATRNLAEAEARYA